MIKKGFSFFVCEMEIIVCFSYVGVGVKFKRVLKLEGYIYMRV